jgi:16S rRNA (guanine527-N7)-methyltransferase
MDAFIPALREALAESKTAISEGQLEKMAAFFALLEEANRAFNLTAIEGPEEAAIRHFADSLAPPALAALLSGWRIIDVGTGAGFPGLPLAIAREDLHITLLDSVRKKTQFLETAILRLGIKNAAVVTARAEDYARAAGREAFDAAVSRAVASMNVLLEYMLPFPRVGGLVLMWKGPAAPEEMAGSANACRALGGNNLSSHPYSLKDRGAFFIVSSEKVRPVPPEYPRKAGKPLKSPII